MKLLILICLLLSGAQAQAIELVLNGITYNIGEYKITNNGQRIVINHSTLKKTSCTQSRRQYPTQVRYKKYRPHITAPKKQKQRRAPSSVGAQQFWRGLLQDLETNEDRKKRKRRYQ